MTHLKRTCERYNYTPHNHQKPTTPNKKVRIWHQLACQKQTKHYSSRVVFCCAYTLCQSTFSSGLNELCMFCKQLNFTLRQAVELRSIERSFGVSENIRDIGLCDWFYCINILVWHLLFRYFGGSNFPGSHY